MSGLLRRATGTIGRPSVWLAMVLALVAAIAITGIVVPEGSHLLGLLAAGLSFAATAPNTWAARRPTDEPATHGPRRN